MKISRENLHVDIGAQRVKTPPHVSFLFKNGDFFPCVLAYSPHVSGENGNRKRMLPNLSSVEIFENACLSFSCGQTKTEVFEYDDVIHHKAHAV